MDGVQGDSEKPQRSRIEDTASEHRSWQRSNTPFYKKPTIKEV
jgi:hypothetical protein